MPENKPDGLKSAELRSIAGCGGLGRKAEQRREKKKKKKSRGLEGVAGFGGADELMAVVSSQSKQALTVQGKG